MKKTAQEDLPRSQKKKARRIVLWALLGLVLAGLALGGWQAYRILKQPASLFAEAPAATAIPQATILDPAFPVHTVVPEAETKADASPGPKAAVSPAITAEPTATPKPVERLNVLLMGIDAFENGRTTSGTMPHTDVIMLIAINFDENKVDLISLPRDTMTTAPGYYGIYKLNGVFNVGLGGWKRPTGRSDELADGFLLTCRAAEEWMGGISIPYYYGLDFKAVVDIVDAIGGIDYDVGQPFSAYQLTDSSMTSGKHYGKGMHHLDGEAVLGYLRIRQNADGLDSSRTARQRRMMVAIFNKLKTEGKLSQIPSLIAAANSGIYTNTTLSQTTALANYAARLDSSNIQTRSMFGELGTVEYEWRYAYVDQQNRLDIIREVFGIEAEPVGTCTRQYERWLHTVGFSAMKYMRQAEKVLTYIQELKDSGQAFTEEQIALYIECYRAYAALKESFDSATDTLADRYAAAAWREKKSNRKNWTEENKTADQELSFLEADILQSMNDLKAVSKDATVRLGDAVGFKTKLTWNVPIEWFKDPDINEVIVNFG